MNLINNASLDKKIFQQLQTNGMTMSEAIQLVMCEIYYLSYKDRDVMRRAISFLGEDKKDTIVLNIQMHKRNNYLNELQGNKVEHERIIHNFLF
ncbi:hypothetical protein [Aliivibrio logei]|jgi:uncharacterized protein YoaH (UPF0181 family)|uniref:hypothetical protein n=1 Tax=Aliivibrio logei TaxID=688 RepID=UPI0035C92438